MYWFLDILHTAYINREILVLYHLSELHLKKNYRGVFLTDLCLESNVVADKSLNYLRLFTGKRLSATTN